MRDGHIHIEQGDYTLDWIRRFADRAVETGMREIWLLEHCYLFAEFVPMYGAVCAHSSYVDAWFHRKAGKLRLSDYLTLIEQVRRTDFPVSIRFGLEICYFPEYEAFVKKETRGCGLDFLLGSVHFIDRFAFDHKAEHWEGVDVDSAYRTYFETSISLAQSGLFDGIAHPDCIKLFGHKASFDLTAYYERLAQALAAQRMYAEESSGIFRRCPETAAPGMDAALLSCMKRHHIPIVTVSDAHCPEDVGDHIAEMTERIAQD
ncbi:MAG: histidinol phosphate phosphatase [Ruminococcaceae bacterium]|nr:histidinol phosphate phosphatase [Oscillospiraceae bacterium]